MGLLTGLFAFEVFDFLNSFTGNRVFEVENSGKYGVFSIIAWKAGMRHERKCWKVQGEEAQ